MKAFTPLVIWLVLLASLLPTSSLVCAAKNPLSISASMAYDIHSFDGELFDSQQVLDTNENELRRLKLSSKYSFNKDFSVKASTKYDLDKNRFVVDDIYLKAEFGSRFELTSGKFKEPFGLENLEGFSNQYLMERSVATNSLTFSRKPGVNVLTKGDLWRWDIAVMYNEAKSSHYSHSPVYVSRFTFTPVLKKNRFMHFGAGLSVRDGVEKKYDIDETLIAHAVGNLIHSPNINAQSIQTSNIEFAAKYGAFVLQSEALFQEVKERGGETYEYGGYYTSLLWTVMGRSRSYKDGEVVFAKPKKQTLELAFRFSMADIEAHHSGDFAEVISLGVNYYVRSALRLSFQYEKADLKSFNRNDWDSHVKGDAISARLQLMM